MNNLIEKSKSSANKKYDMSQLFIIKNDIKASFWKIKKNEDISRKTEKVCAYF